MDVLGFNLIDLVVVGVIILSGVFALARGFVKEVFSIVSWVAAVFVTLYGFAEASAFARRYITQPLLADAVAGGAIFLITLFVLSYISGRIADRVRGSAVGSVDRSLGFVFGLLRGFVLISIGYMALSWAMPPEDQPKWVRAAKTMPMLERGAALLSDLAPDSFGGTAAKPPASISRPGQPRSAGNSLPPPSGPGYKVDERREMDRLIQGNQ